MSIRIYNSLGRTKETFQPLNEGKVTMYVCGVTTYALCHIGHGRASVVFDVFARHLRCRGYELKYIRNYTDIDDKIIREAAKVGCDAMELSEKYVQAAREDMLSLGCLQPDLEPRVSTHVEQIVGFVKGLIDAGKAYAVENGDVYYSVESFDEYCKLSGKTVADLLDGARVEVAAIKRAPTDFALWKSAKPGEPAWDSPWGPGRPGWHIECSAMCREHLGDTIDIHGGGSDLIFPHHENEIAQSEGLTGKPLARYWVHNAMLTIGNEKMSKSLSNFLTIREILKRYHRESVRLYFLNTHHRSPIDFSDCSLEQAEIALERLYMAKGVATAIANADPTFAEPLAELQLASGCTYGGAGVITLVEKAIKNLPEGKLSKAEAALKDVLLSAPDRIEQAIDDDFNSARALGVVFEIARGVLRYKTSHARPTANGAPLMLAALSLLHGVCATRLGLVVDDPEVFRTDLNVRRLAGQKISVEEVDALVAERRLARDSKDWAEADRLRDVLAAHKIVLEDASDKTIWRAAPAAYDSDCAE